MKVKIKSIVNHLNSEYPFKVAEDWDKVGYVNGNLNLPISKVIVTLDLTNEVFEKAIKEKAELIVTHHPFIFNDDIEKDFREAPYKKELHERLLNTGINLVTLHTNYDSTNHETASQILNYLDVKIINKENKYGLIFSTEKALAIEEMEDMFKEKLGLKFIQKNIRSKRAFSSWGILPGSGSPEDIIDLKNKGADVIITSDIKWSTWIMANEENIRLIQVSHVIEDVFTKHISGILQKKYKSLKVIPMTLLDI